MHILLDRLSPEHYQWQCSVGFAGGSDTSSRKRIIIWMCFAYRCISKIPGSGFECESELIQRLTAATQFSRSLGPFTSETLTWKSKPMDFELESESTAAANDKQRSSTAPARVSRQRPGAACLGCRQRKMRCDGQQPCGSCFDSGISCEPTGVQAQRGPKKGHMKALQLRLSTLFASCGVRN